MKKAVISTGSKQYLVTEGDTIEVELLKVASNNVEFTPLLMIEDGKTSVGSPEVEGAKVTATIVEPEIKAEKVTSIRYKAKKRVRKVRGHRQRQTQIKITKIALSKQ